MTNHEITPIDEIFDDEAAELYDMMYFNGDSFTTQTNELIVKHLEQAGAKNILDMSCGTGSQCIELSLAGYNVEATDLSNSMLKRAKEKAKLHNVDIKFKQADMKSVTTDECQGIISIFNSIGYLNKEDFATTLRNASNNLEPNGVFIFDTFHDKALAFIPAVEFVDCDIMIDKKHVKRFTKIFFNKTEGNCIITRRIEITEESGDLREINECVQFSVYEEQEMIDLVKENGFSSVEIVRQSMLELRSIKNSMNLVIAKK